MEDAEAVEVGDEVDDHPEAVAVAVEQHELAAAAHRAHAPLKLARALKVAVEWPVRARVPLGRRVGGGLRLR